MIVRSKGREWYDRNFVPRVAPILGLEIGWHTFRHSYRSWLDETGAPMKVQQELMRHASIQTTMNVYGQAMLQRKHEANSKVVEMALRGALQCRNRARHGPTEKRVDNC